MARQPEQHHAPCLDVAPAQAGHPDACVFDLDPSREEPKVLRDSALRLRALLEELGLASWIKTSGSKGFHIVVPLDAVPGFGEVARFADDVARVLVARDPVHLTREFAKADRGGRILVDTGRNGYSATFAAPYTVRARPGAPVSAPCTWMEVEHGTAAPRTFTLRGMEHRVAGVGDLWSEMPGQSLRQPIEQVRRLIEHESGG